MPRGGRREGAGRPRVLLPRLRGDLALLAGELTEIDPSLDIVAAARDALERGLGSKSARDAIERMISRPIFAHGGARPGAGRPRGSLKLLSRIAVERAKRG